MQSHDASEAAEFCRLFDEAYRPLLAYAARRTGNMADAEEIASEALLVAWRRREEPGRSAHTLPWLYGVARRLIANQCRAARRRQRLERMLGPLARSRSDPEQTAEVAGVTRAVVAASLRLPEADREVLRLAAWEGLSHEDIAVSLGCSENAAALRLHRARRRLRAELLKEDSLPGQEPVKVTR